MSRYAHERAKRPDDSAAGIGQRGQSLGDPPARVDGRADNRGQIGQIRRNRRAGAARGLLEIVDQKARAVEGLAQSIMNIRRQSASLAAADVQQLGFKDAPLRHILADAGDSNGLARCATDDRVIPAHQQHLARTAHDLIFMMPRRWRVVEDLRKQLAQLRGLVRDETLEPIASQSLRLSPTGERQKIVVAEAQLGISVQSNRKQVHFAHDLLKAATQVLVSSRSIAVCIHELADSFLQRRVSAPAASLRLGMLHYDGAKDADVVLEIVGMGPETLTPAEAK